MKTRALSLLLLFVILCISAGTTIAANCTVTTAADHVDQNCNGDCSLREAILEPTCTAISFSLDLAGVPIVLTGGELAINRNLSITGWGADAITISGNNTSRIFYVGQGSTLNLSGLTLRDGNGVGTLPANGGAIRSIGATNLDGVYVTASQAPGKGAAISYEGDVTNNIQNSSISYNLSSPTDPANAAIAHGGGGFLNIFNSSLYFNTGSALNIARITKLINSTVIYNGAPRQIYVQVFGSISFANSIAKGLFRAGNFAGVGSDGNNMVSTAPGSVGITYAASDQVGADPLVDAPQFYGGHVPVMALQPGSTAIDRGNNDRTNQFSLTTDQRGFNRFVGGVGDHPITDIGAYEFNSPAPAPVTVAGRVLGGFSGNPLRSQTVTIKDMFGNRWTTLTSSLGWFVFDNMPSGFVYRVSVNARRGPQQKTVFADQNLSDVDILVPGQ